MSKVVFGAEDRRTGGKDLEEVPGSSHEVAWSHSIPVPSYLLMPIDLRRLVQRSDE